MTASEIMSLLVAGGALIVAILGARRTSHGDTAASAEERARMSADINYIRTGIDEIKLEYRAIQRDIVTMREDIVRLEASVKSAHKRIDDMGGKKNV